MSGQQEQPSPSPPPPPPPPQQYPDVLAPDSRHSWIIAAAAAWNVFCCSLLRRTMPVMFRAVGDAFATSSKGSVAWMNAFIYSLAYTLSPVTSMLSRILPLRSLSVAGAILVGASQVICFLLGSLATMVAVIGLLCGLGSALSTVVDEMALHLHFEKQRRKALALYGAAFSLSAIVYPPVFLTLVDTYGLNGALLVSGALSLNGIAGSVVITRPVWLPPDIPLPPLYSRASAIVAQVEAPPPAQPQEKDAKGDAAGIAKDALTADMPTRARQTTSNLQLPDPVGKHSEDPASIAGLPSAAPSVATSVVASGLTSGAASGAASGFASVDGILSPSSPAYHVAFAASALRTEASVTTPQGETGAADTCGMSSIALVALAEQQGATIDNVFRHKGASPTAAGSEVDNTIGVVLVFYCALTSLSVTAGAVVYDYAMAGDRRRSVSAAVVLVSLGVGDLLGRVGYEILLATGEHRKVMAVQAFLQGGVLFLMALAEEIFLLVPVSFALGWLSSTLDMLPVPVLRRFVEPDIVDKQLGLCRGASGVACLLGPALVMIFRDGGSKSYSAVFVVSGCLSLLAGTLWLPGLKKELDEARAKAATAVAPPAAKGVDMNAVVTAEEAADQPEPEKHDPDAVQAGNAENHSPEADAAGPRAHPPSEAEQVLSDEAEAQVPPPGSHPGGARPGGP
ncbi:uncharacterized protein LOC119432617 [Dermacentor silvarum]|uniref:uncharacterized protein LOC119432617 n=1 Tax=Dermacentor silvarum TaxID=543639 RepID=UPI0021009251|nr:uncharacterized protein LOC119432617 [Dermacentor silvarum]